MAFQIPAYQNQPFWIASGAIIVELVCDDDSTLKVHSDLMLDRTMPDV